MKKHGRNEYPDGLSAGSFKCHGPVATKGKYDFSGVMLVDLNFFDQSGKDSNKYYHAAVVSGPDGAWYLYKEWGRTGKSPAFQFESYDSQDQAQAALVKQVESKSIKRGTLEFDADLNREELMPKAGKDCYRIVEMAVRETGLPDAATVMSTTSASTKPVKKAPTKKTSSKPAADSHTIQLMQDLNVGTVKYTRSVMVGGAVPSQGSIDDARNLLEAARKRLVEVGTDIDDQHNDSRLLKLSTDLYKLIPKKKKVHSSAANRH